MSNTRIWDKLGKTDPSQTKGFTRSGGFKGTAIKPIWCALKMTELFGPCGIGWGMTEPQFQVMPAVDEVMVYCTVGLWYSEEGVESKVVYGVGGDKVLVKQSSGLRSSDEAFKMAYTDALGNAMKFIGVAADIHMGLFDDNKYVQEMKEEFTPKAEIKKFPPPKNLKQALTESNTFITEEQRLYFIEVATKRGKSKQDIVTALKAAGIEKTDRIPAASYDSWISWSEGA